MTRYRITVTRECERCADGRGRGRFTAPVVCAGCFGTGWKVEGEPVESGWLLLRWRLAFRNVYPEQLRDLRLDALPLSLPAFDGTTIRVEAIA